MKTQKSLIKSISLIVFVLIVAISCGEIMTDPKGGTDGWGGQLLLWMKT